MAEKMTEREWLESVTPERLLDYLLIDNKDEPSFIVPHPFSHLASDRKMRLFCCACVRNSAAWSPPEKDEIFSKSPITAAAEAHADDPRLALPGAVATMGLNTVLRTPAYTGAQQWVKFAGRTKPFIAWQAALMREIFGNPFREINTAWICKEGFIPHLAPDWVKCQTVYRLAKAAYEERKEHNCTVCMGRGNLDVYSGMGDALSYEPHECKYCINGKVKDRFMDEEIMRVLSDALEDAGCEEEDMLQHLRGFERCYCCMGLKTWYSGGVTSYSQCAVCSGVGWNRASCSHVKGCWAVDILTNRR